MRIVYCLFIWYNTTNFLKTDLFQNLKNIFFLCKFGRNRLGPMKLWEKNIFMWFRYYRCTCEINLYLLNTARCNAMITIYGRFTWAVPVSYIVSCWFDCIFTSTNVELVSHWLKYLYVFVLCVFNTRPNYSICYIFMVFKKKEFAWTTP